MRNPIGTIRPTLALWVLCTPWPGRLFPAYAGNVSHATRDAFEERNRFDPVETNREGYASTDKTLSTSPSCLGPNREEGRCEYFRECFSDEYGSNFTLATNHACPVERTYVGICCASRRSGEHEKSIAGQGFADVLPLIAVNDGDDRSGNWNEAENTVTAGRIVWSDNEGGAPSTPRPPRRPERSRGCGTTWRSRSKLVGGRPADPTEWPWMAALLRKDRTQYCGGVLVTDRHVLTAAHCVYSFEPRDIKVRLGEYDFATTEESRAFDFAVSEIRVHPEFDFTTYENDVAMIKLHRPTVFDSHVWPVCLPPIAETFENKSAVVTGWGTSYYGGPASTVLMEVELPIWPQEKCAQSFVQRIPRTAMCAGGYEGGRDACQGDSGGPLLHRLGNGRWVNVGIVSWGIRCGEPGRPGVYTRVNSYLDWIFENAVF